LTGAVTSYVAYVTQEAVEKAAWRIAGVTEVTNNITVQPL
jgi:osmotically-inducible protein OsmY